MGIPFHVLVLGSGSAIPRKAKNHSSQLIVHEGSHILLDCGEGSQFRMRKFGVSVQKLDHILISHLHGDHYLGLPGLISSMNLLGRERDLTIVGPEGLREVIDLHFRLAKSGSAFKINYEVTQAKEMKEVLHLGDLRITSFPLKHKIPTTGFLFRSRPSKRKLIAEKLEEYKIPKHLRNGISQGLDYRDESGRTIPNDELTTDPGPERSYAYLSDTAYFPELAESLTPVNTMYHEASFLKKDEDKAKETRHSTAGQAAEMAKACKAEKLLIGHFSAKYDDDEVFLKESREIFPNTELAIEGERYEVV